MPKGGGAVGSVKFKRWHTENQKQRNINQKKYLALVDPTTKNKEVKVFLLIRGKG